MKEVHVPSKLQRASQKHNMPFSPSSNKASNVKLVVPVRGRTIVFSILCNIFLKGKFQSYSDRILFHSKLLIV